MSKLSFPPEEIKPKVHHLSPGRWGVESSDGTELYLVKWWEAEKRFTCSCPWGTKGSTSKICKHSNAVLNRVYAGDFCLGSEIQRCQNDGHQIPCRHGADGHIACNLGECIC